MLSDKNINRLVAMIVIWALAVIVVQARLLGLQLLSSKSFKKRACQQQRKPQDVPARRGTIYDRNGVVLAIDNLFYDIYGDPSQIDNPELVDSVLCQIFQRPKGYYSQKIADAYGRFFVYLEWRVDMAQAAEVRRHRLSGVAMTPIYNRFYPYGKIASTIIGCVGHDGEGLDGIEYLFNEELSGTPTQKIVFSDAFGKTYPLLCYSTGEPVPGCDLYLTIDIRLQQILQSELEKTIKENHADGAYSVFINPKTGEILAMASVPNYDPNEYSKYPLNLRRNRVITDPYEPGSIFKLVTMAAALSEHLVSLADTIDTKNGRAVICGRKVTDVHRMGKISTAEVIIHSSNIGIVKIAQMLDKKTLYEYIKRFGFGTITGIDLPGEADGILRTVSKWWGTSMATIPMGYEVSATPLQIVCAYGVVANHGKLMRPFAVKKCIRSDGEIKWQKNPMIVRQAIPKEVADTLNEMFRKVVTEGTGKMADSPFLALAGKTGTTHKQKTGERGYHEKKYFSSFVGYAPYEDPKIVGLVVVDNPRSGAYYGGTVAAPILRTVMEKATSSGILQLPTERTVTMENTPQKNKVYVPNLIRTTPEQAIRLLQSRGLAAKFYGIGDIVADQSPQHGRAIEPNSVVILYLKPILPKSGDSLKVPDVRGMTIRDAINKLASANVPFRVEGHGVVTEQSPPPNTMIDTNGVCIILCRPKGAL